MNKKNLLFVAMLFFAANTFAQMDMSLVPYRSGDKWGYATPEKTIVIQPKYNDASWFSNGYAAVKIGSKYGYINKAGKVVIPAKFTVAKPFRKGYVPKANKEGGDSVLFAGASMTSDGYEKCIDTKGRVMIKCPAINENSIAENNVPVETVVKQKTYSLPDNAGLFDKIYDDYKITGSNETYYIAEKNGMYGVFNSKFETIVPFEYSSIKKIMSGQNEYLQVTKNNMNGIVSASGQTLINPDNSNLVMINGINKTDYVIVKHDGRTYVKDLKNNDVISTGYSDIAYDNNGGFVITGDDNSKGFYFMDAKIIAPKYSDVHLVPGGEYLIIRTANGKTGYVNQNGDEFFVE